MNVNHFSGFCQKTTFNVGVQSYNSQSVFRIKDPDDNTTKQNESGRYINMYYSTTNVKISTTSKLLNLSSFISSVGGNLGLFVGFSFLSAVTCLFKLLERSTRKVVRQSMRVYCKKPTHDQQEKDLFKTPMWM